MWRPFCTALIATLAPAVMPVVAGAVTVSIDPPDTTVEVGDEFVVRIVTDAFPDLKGFKLIFPYDETRLQLLGAVEGEVLTSPGGAYVAFLIPDVSAPADTFQYDAAMLEGATAGPGILVYATFKALAPGDAAIDCGSVDFRDSFNQQTIPACNGAVVHIGTPPAPAVRISQVYGGGGNSGATYRNDFVELFNAGGATADLTGWSVQYASASGSTWQTTTLAGTIPPGGYYLVQQAQGAGGTLDLPTPDATGSIPMSLSSGKVAVVASTTPLSGSCPIDASIADFVGYGTADCAETSPAPVLSNTTAGFRELDGCEDTDDNAADFFTAAPAPRNSASPLNPCATEVTLTVSADPPAGGTVTKSPDQATYTVGATVELTATPAPGWYFIHWSGDAAGSANPLMVTMNGSKTIAAHFSTSIAPKPVVISQVYGGGGNSGATYKNDFIELFNRGNLPVDITGWSVQYASATGSGWFSTTLVGTIQPGRYYLVQQAAGTGGTLDLPTPDAIGGVAMSANSGKVALVNDAVILSGGCPTDPSIEDFVGYGPANCAEGTPTSSLNNLSAAHRKEGGCIDTDANLLDFETLGPMPRHSASPLHLCSYWVSVDRDAPAPDLALAIAPNPVRGTAYMSFALPQAGPARLRVFDLQGRVVATIADGVLPAGRHQVAWAGGTPNGPARSGVYFVRLQAAGLTLQRALVLAR